MNRVLYDLDRGTRSANGMVGTSAHPGTQNVAKAPFSGPADLTAFMASRSVTQIMLALNVSRGTAHRLRDGYWPQDARKLQAAWEHYKGRSTQQQSGWFLRRVHAGGTVRHAGRDWTAHGLAARIGQTMAVARAEGDVLLAQTLDMPSERLPLAPVEA